MEKWILSLVWVISLGVTLIGILLLQNPAIAAINQATVEWLAPEVSDSPAFQKVMAPSPLHFPKDFGPHEDYQTEWWYYTGNLETPVGQPFGYELTIFRRGLTPGQIPPQASNASRWRSNQVYFAHFTLSDMAHQAFYPAERFSRGAAGLAGAQAKPYRVWLEDWNIQELTPGQVRLQAKTDRVALDLTLEQTLPPILQGDRGYSPKGSEPGNASYYYSLVRQRTQGTVTVQGESSAVEGVSWTDHEYSTSALSPGTAGWDWFSLQFEDGSALMLYGLRRIEGTIAPESSGTFIAADGSTQHLTPADWTVEVLDHWTSPKSGAIYPARWQITLPKLDRTLIVKPALANQELNLSTVYWEGAVTVQGHQAQQPIQGRGYVELTGYNQRLSF